MMTLKKLIEALMGMFGCQREQFSGGKGCYDLPGSPSLCAMCWLYQARGVPYTETLATMRKNMQTYFEKHR